MNDKNTSINLDCDDDVVFFEKDTFKVSRLKELMIREVRRITDIQQNRNKNCVHRLLKQIKIGEESFNFYYIKFENTKNCQILQVNNKGWQKGKLNIEICISSQDNKLDKVNLKFFPEQPTELESPLDDIREMIKTN